MGVILAVVTVCGVFAIIGFLLILFCHYFHGWTWTTNYMFNSSNEEKMVLTKPGHYYNSNGCMIPSSDSEFHLSGRGSFRRFDKTDQDYSLLRQGSVSSLTRSQANLPPQPLRPAPIPPYITGPLRSQGSVDSVFSSGPSSPAPTQFPSTSISRKPEVPFSSLDPKGEAEGGMASGGFANLSANNPFLPLIQASTQFISQKFQSFQAQPNGSTNEFSVASPPSNHAESNNVNYSKPEPLDQELESMTSSRNSYSSTSTMPSSAGLSMGEILFSSPPAHSIPDQHPQLKEPDQRTQRVVEEIKIPSQKLESRTEYSRVTKDYPDNKESSHVHQDPNALKTCMVADSGSSQKAENNIVDHLEARKHGMPMPNISTKPHCGENFYTADHQKSPTRLRDRQRKMEFTLQHLQNNQEDRCMGKKHYNPDSHYPTSTPYVPKHGEGSGESSGSINSKSRFRYPYGIGHHTVPPVTEIEEPVEYGGSDPLKMEMSNSLETSSLRNPIQEVDEEENEEASSQSFLETMREEIRLENERMADATKSLMMEEDFSSEKVRSNGTTSDKHWLPQMCVNPSTENSYGKGIHTKTPKRLSSTEEEEDSSKILHTTSSNNANGDFSVNSRLISSQSPSTESVLSSVRNYIGLNSVPTSLSVSTPGTVQHPTGDVLTNHSLANTVAQPQIRPPFRNTRSFSLRQSSTESIGSMDGSESPDGLPSLQRAMSCDSVSSDTSVILGDLEPPHVSGLLCIGLEYDSENSDLLVNVLEAKELVGPDPSSTAPFDTYVRVYLLPDKTTNMQTRVYRKSFNPVFREKFMFGLETMELPLRTLVFYLYGTDKHSNTLVGEAELKLGDLDIYQPTTTWLQLTDTGQRGGESGEIMFSLSYLPTAERLTVVVVKARNLKFPHQRETGDPFVKVYLLQKGKKVSKKKSSTKKGERNPIFNEAMIFSVPAHTLQTIQLRITVADSSEIEGRAYSVGHVIVGSSATGKSLSHWNQMLTSLRKPIAMWHPLRK